jgi:flagellar biosynthesis/type III secretory pathway chaperone
MSEIQRQLDELLDTMAVLTSLFDEETRALKTRDLDAIPALVSRKISLAQLFEGQLSWLSELRDRLGDEITPDQKAALNDCAERFKQGLLTNVAALDAQRRASERVVSLIIDGVKRATEENGSYSRSSQMSSVSGPLSVALNATF